MSVSLATALLTIGEHPLCSSVELKQSYDLALWFYVQNDQNVDYADSEDLANTLASYDETGAPYRLTVLLPVEEEAFACA
jgi:hypothetical protein